MPNGLAAVAAALHRAGARLVLVLPDGQTLGSPPGRARARVVFHDDAAEHHECVLDSTALIDFESVRIGDRFPFHVIQRPQHRFDRRLRATPGTKF